MPASTRTLARASALTLLTLTLIGCGGTVQPPVLSGTPVTSLADAGPGSLRETLAAAKDGDTLRFTAQGAVTLASALVVDKDVTLFAEGVTFDATGKGRVLQVAAEADVTIRGGILKGGVGSVLPASLQAPELSSQATSRATPDLKVQAEPVATYAGVILNRGNLTLDGVTVTGGTATLGGGIANLIGGSLTLSGTTRVTGNQAVGFERGVPGLSGAGGGVYNSGTLSVTGGSISNNMSTWGGAGVYNIEPGTMSMTAGAIDNNACTATVDTINGVTSGCGGAGIFTNGNLTVSGGNISNNSASYFGGGLAVMMRGGTNPYPNVVISGGTLEGNKTTDATRSGGGAVFSIGVLTIGGGTFRGNTSPSGGAVNNWGDLKIQGGVFEGNQVVGYGGAVFNYRQARSFEMTGGTMTANTAGQNGGAINLDGRGSMTGGTIENNTAQGNGGGIQLYSAAGQKTTFTLGGNAVIRGNQARFGAGVSVGSAEAAGTTLVIKAGTISGNAATLGGGGLDVGRGAVMNLSGGSISGNTAVGTGGGIAGSGTVNMTGGDINGNAVTGTSSGEGGGGGVRLYTDAVFTASGGTIRNNTSLYGGGVFIGSAFESRPAGQFVLSGAVVSGNKIGNNVGGGFFNDGVLTIQSGSVTANVARQDAGGVFNTVRSTYTHTGGTVSGNQPNDVVRGK